MAVSLVINSKTSSSISATVTKTVTNSTGVYVGPGTTYENIYANNVAHTTVGNGSTGSFNVSFTSGLTANTQYGIVAFAVGGGSSGISSVLDATLPAPALASQSVGARSIDSATINYTTAVDGGYLPKTIEYSLDNGTTWVTVATVTSGSAASGSFTVSSLSPGESYTMLTRVSTTAGSTTGSALTFTTLSSKKKLYGSVDGYAESITGLYGSSANQAVTITKFYGSVNRQAKLLYQGFGHISYN